MISFISTLFWVVVIELMKPALRELLHRVLRWVSNNDRILKYTRSKGYYLGFNGNGFCKFNIEYKTQILRDPDNWYYKLIIDKKYF